MFYNPDANLLFNSGIYFNGISQTRMFIEKDVMSNSTNRDELQVLFYCGRTLKFFRVIIFQLPYGVSMTNTTNQSTSNIARRKGLLNSSEKPPQVKVEFQQ